jgi:DNA-binding transcriptional LysR family regulator
LEYELNTLLFYRTNRGIELTPEAKALRVYVEKAYNYLMLGERELQEGKELTKGTVSIGTSTHLSIYYLNKYIKKFMKSHPNIVINISNHNDVRLFELLQQHNLDLLITTGEFKANKDLKTIELSKTEYCFSYDKTKLELPEITTLEEIFNNQVLLPSKTTKQRIELEKILSKKNIISSPIMEVESSETMLNYIKEGMGIGYIQKNIAIQSPDLEIINIAEQLPEETITLIYNDESLTTSSREFINMITNQ